MISIVADTMERRMETEKWPFTTLLHFLVHQSPFNRFNLKDRETEKKTPQKKTKSNLLESKNILQSGISSGLERGE